MKRLLMIFVLLGLFTVVAQAQTLIRVPQDQPTVQAGINAAVNGDTVLVEEGTYVENVKINKKIVLGSRFILDGDTAHISRTIIDGSAPAHPDTGSTISIGVGTDTTTVVAGFTVTKGTGNVHYDLFFLNANVVSGGGIDVAAGGVKILNNIIRENVVIRTPSRPNAWGAGISAQDWISLQDISYVIIDGNTIEANTSVGTDSESGGISFWLIDGRITNNIIANNSADIVGGVSVGSPFDSSIDTVVVEGNTIRGNLGNNRVGGLAASYSKCVVYIRNNVITDNTSPSVVGGMAVGDTVRAVVEGNYIARNIGPVGGIVLSRNSNSTIVQNNIIVNNSAYAVDVGLGVAQLTACVLVNNTIVGNASGVGVGSSSVAYLMNNILRNTGAEITGNGIAGYNLIEGGFTGTGNINADPVFVMHTDSFYIHYTSPARNAGVVSANVGGMVLTAPTKDYRGMTRDGTPDLGAHEFDALTGVELLTSNAIPERFALSQNYPNPFNPTTAISYQLSAFSMVTLKVYDILGREVATLVSGEQSAGVYKAEWNASVASGVYFYRLEAFGNDGSHFINTKKMVLVR